ncbi:hypothetical protein AX17_005618 [Amanita inopinata Kibby_2008]|nr:hypothetical protein AX17_005618 [Amanita inopinata Kibby_2008]
MTHTTVVSSPGKVLIAGGYLVLDPAYSGITISTSSRFYTVLQDCSTPRPNCIRVRSPQFLDAEWYYTVSFEPALSIEPSVATTNKFVHLALQHSLLLAAEVKGITSIKNALSAGLDITIVGDNDFYSQRAKLVELNLPRTLQSLAKLAPFLPTGVSLRNVHKTGLGSSASLITSLVSALLLHLSVIPESSFEKEPANSETKEQGSNNHEGRHLAHNLAQYVHCLAQGKVGSGFDVAAAAFGSQLYTRFSPAVIQVLLDRDATNPRPLLPVLSPQNRTWDYRTEPFALPPLTRIMLADVDAGSDTPSLVGKVLKWRKEAKQDADALWGSLDQLNQSLAQTLLQLSRLHVQDPKNYESAVKYISSLQPVQWEANPWQPPAEQPIVAMFYEAHRISQAIRAKMKEMGSLSGVPIEPVEQTKLLDMCTSQAGVIGGGVPGAGGYDAVWVLVCDPMDCYPDQHPRDRIEHLWSNYKELDVSPLSVTESISEGSRIEVLDDVPGLGEAVLVKEEI